MTTFDLISCFVCGAIAAEALRYVIHNVAHIVRHIRRERRLQNDQAYNHRRFEELARQTSDGWGE